VSRHVTIEIRGTSKRVIPLEVANDGNLYLYVEDARRLAKMLEREVDAVDPMRLSIVPHGRAIPIGGGALLIVPPETTDAEIAAFTEPFTNGVDMAVCPMPKGGRLVHP